MLMIKFQNQQIQQTSTHEIAKVILKLKISNIVGWDNIPTKIIKVIVNILAPIPSNLINKSSAQVVYPNSLKEQKSSWL